MDNKEILERANDESKLDEREKALSHKANLIAAIVMSVFAVAFVIVTAALEMRPAYCALTATLFAYCATLYISRYILFEKKVGLLIGGILYAIACVAMVVCFILSIVLGW